MQKKKKIDPSPPIQLEIKLSPLSQIKEEEPFAIQFQKQTKSLDAYLVRTFIRKTLSKILETKSFDVFFVLCVYACKNLPFWMKWRCIDDCYEKKEILQWKETWFNFDELKKKNQCKHQERTYELFQKWNQNFIPCYKNDEWAQICPDEITLAQYGQLVQQQQHQKGEIPNSTTTVMNKKYKLVKCYSCKKILFEQPFFFPLEYYTSVDQFVFETKFCFCSPQCCRKWLQEQKEFDYREFSILVAACTKRRWNFPWAPQCAPPVAILPVYSDPSFSPFEEKVEYIKYLKEIDKKINDEFDIVDENSLHSIFETKMTDDENKQIKIEKWWKENHQKISIDLITIKNTMKKNLFLPPKNYYEYDLCISLNCCVYEIYFKPFYPQHYHLYPTISDIFPFGINNQGPHLNYQLGTFAKD